MSGDQVPEGTLWDEDAEARVLGSCLQAGRLVGVAARQLAATDFVRPSHRWLFALLVELHTDGRADPNPMVAVMNELRLRAPERPTRDDVLALEANSPGTGERAFGESIRQVLRFAVARRVALAAVDIRQRAKAADDDPDSLLDYARSVLAEIQVPVTRADQVDGLSTVDDFLAENDTRPAPWVLPGLLRAGWRAMIVAQEGQGKSVCTRQLAICAAQGVHPFEFSPIPPVRTLIVDLENPDDSIAATTRPIVARAKLAVQDYQPGRAWLWRRPGGLDIRSRTGRGQLEAVVAATLPDLVCLGPIYKAYRVERGESDERVAGEVMGVLDDLRTRYNFALVLEHHAPKAQAGVRDLLPYGSSLWLRWPELGIKFTPLKDHRGAVKVERWRLDRVENAWPDELHRGGLWPWTGKWNAPAQERTG